MKLASAGNTEAPAYLVLVAQGFDVSRDKSRWCARKEDVELVGDGPLELLGLAALVEARGESWRATDAEIDAFLSTFRMEG